jgi:hypothetical protein
MDKKHSYNTNDNGNTPRAGEPTLAYRTMPNVDISALPFMSTQEMLQSGMPLEVSRSMTLRKIHSAFHKV